MYTQRELNYKRGKESQGNEKKQKTSEVEKQLSEMILEGQSQPTVG